MGTEGRPRRGIGDPRTWMGVAAIAVAILLLSEVSVRVFVVGTRPNLDETQALVDFTVRTQAARLTVVLIDTVLMAFLIVFLAGFRRVATELRPDLEWVAALVFGAGLVFVGVTLVGDGMDAGTALDTAGTTPDPSVIRALTVGHATMFGAIASVLLALGSTASGCLVLATAMAPRWIVWFAFVVAALNLAAIPTAFGGTDDGSFLSAGGPGVALFATFPWIAWVVVVGVLAFRRNDAPYPR